MVQWPDPSPDGNLVGDQRPGASPDEPPLPLFSNPDGYHHFGIRPLKGYSGVLVGVRVWL